MLCKILLCVSCEEMDQIINDSFFDSLTLVEDLSDSEGLYLYLIEYKDGSSEHVYCEGRYCSLGRLS